MWHIRMIYYLHTGLYFTLPLNEYILWEVRYKPVAHCSLYGLRIEGLQGQASGARKKCLLKKVHPGKNTSQKKCILEKIHPIYFWTQKKCLLTPEMNFFSKCSSKFCDPKKMPPRKFLFKNYLIYFNIRYEINIKLLQDKQLYNNVI